MRIIVIIILSLILFGAMLGVDIGAPYTPYETSDVQEETKQVELETEPGTKPKDEHKHGKIFSFQFQGSTASSYVKPWCKSDSCYHLGYTLFRGTPSDLSYLDVIKEHIGVDEIVGGEYYTVTAVITVADYDFQKTRISCKIQNEDIIVGFSVEFRDEFEDAVSLLDEGDEVTFRGRYYDEGCGFTDCELITE